jgi:hypothetical protein
MTTMTVLSFSKGSFAMNTSLRIFLFQLFRVVLATALPVLLVAFVTIPFNLGVHPGELRNLASMSMVHNT